MSDLTAVQLALARHHVYRLLSRLYLEGVTSDLLPAVQAIPELAAGLPGSFDPDETAADYQHLFGFNLFPYESIFLDTTGLLGGAVTESVSQAYRRAGFWPDTSATSPDHVGVELALLAFLAGAEADAGVDDLTAVAGQMRRQQAGFLQAHLLCWLPPLVLGLRQQARPFYTALADLTLGFLGSEMELSGTFRETLVAETPFLLPTPPALLADDRTGLKEIAAYLATPPYSGVYLSRDDIGCMARQHRLPRGFGSRQQMLMTLLRSAVQYEALPALLGGLRAFIARWQIAYGEMADAMPELAPFTAAWQARAMETGHILTEIERVKANLSPR